MLIRERLDLTQISLVTSAFDTLQKLCKQCKRVVTQVAVAISLESVGCSWWLLGCCWGEIVMHGHQALVVVAVCCPQDDSCQSPPTTTRHHHNNHSCGKVVPPPHLSLIFLLVMVHRLSWTRLRPSWPTTTLWIPLQHPLITTTTTTTTTRMFFLWTIPSLLPCIS